MSAPTRLGSVSLILFKALCEAADTVEGYRGQYTPGSQEWCALTELVQQVDGLIDTLVLSPAIEEPAP
jgi:hypothetical protein